MIRVLDFFLKEMGSNGEFRAGQRHGNHLEKMILLPCEEQMLVGSKKVTAEHVSRRPVRAAAMQLTWPRVLKERWEGAVVRSWRSRGHSLMRD